MSNENGLIVRMHCLINKKFIDNIDHFFPLELRESKADEFVNLKQGTMSMIEHKASSSPIYLSMVRR